MRNRSQIVAICGFCAFSGSGAAIALTMPSPPTIAATNARDTMAACSIRSVMLFAPQPSPAAQGRAVVAGYAITRGQTRAIRRPVWDLGPVLSGATLTQSDFPYPLHQRIKSGSLIGYRRDYFSAHNHGQMRNVDERNCCVGPYHGNGVT